MYKIIYVCQIVYGKYSNIYFSLSRKQTKINFLQSIKQLTIYIYNKFICINVYSKRILSQKIDKHSKAKIRVE